MAYTSETEKIVDKVRPFLGGFVIDIGSAGSKVKPDAFGIDGREFEGVDFVTDNLYSLPEQLRGKVKLADCVFSSHCLEHLKNDYEAILSWSHLIKPGGYLILYLPQAVSYDSYQNFEHMRNYNYEDFIFFFKRCFCGEGKDFRGNNFHPIFELVEHDLDLGVDRYSFYLVARKL